MKWRSVRREGGRIIGTRRELYSHEFLNPP